MLWRNCRAVYSRSHAEDTQQGKSAPIFAADFRNVCVMRKPLRILAPSFRRQITIAITTCSIPRSILEKQLIEINSCDLVFFLLTFVRCNDNKNRRRKHRHQLGQPCLFTVTRRIKVSGRQCGRAYQVQAVYDCTSLPARRSATLFGRPHQAVYRSDRQSWPQIRYFWLCRSAKYHVITWWPLVRCGPFARVEQAAVAISVSSLH